MWKGQKEPFDRTWQPYTSIIRQALEKHGESKELLDLDIKLGRWVAAILYFNNRVKDQDPSFDDSARFEVLKKMSEDRRLTSQSIEEESSKIFEQGIRITENVQNERDSVRQGRRLLTQFINETTRTKTWTKDLASIETVTQAFRNVGEFVPELQFHEQFKGDLDMEICEYAKREWIEIKRKQANFSRQDGKIADAERYGREADNAGENVFIVKNGKLYTPELASCLEGITRDSVITLAGELGIPVEQKRITRDEVYCADEAFFTGTAAEVTPIRELDNRKIGIGSRGPVTERIQSAYFDAVNGRNPKHEDWLSFI